MYRQGRIIFQALPDLATLEARIAQLGKTSPLDVGLTAPGLPLGTPAYMSPEQFRGQTITASSDQFNFCVALYEALHGVRPFGGKSLAALEAHMREGTRQPSPLSRSASQGPFLSGISPARILQNRQSIVAPSVDRSSTVKCVRQRAAINVLEFSAQRHTVRNAACRDIVTT